MLTGVDIGDMVTVSTSVTDASGTAVDPSALVLRVHRPVSAELVYTYGTDPEIVQDAAGQYHADIPVTEPGTWRFRWKGTGAATFAEEASLVARQSSFANP